jgi:hypothetical protein
VRTLWEMEMRCRISMTEFTENTLHALVRQLLDRQAESRSLDYKAPTVFGPDKKEKGEFIKSIVAFANTRDGGSILVGVEQSGGKFIPRGVSRDEASSFDPTVIGQFARNYFSLLPTVTSHVVSIDDIDLLLLSIEEFENEPIVCTKDLHGDKDQFILRAGSIYVRTTDSQCAAIDSGETMRAFLDFAIQKRGDALLSQIQRLMGTPAIIAASDPSQGHEREIANAEDLYIQEGLVDPQPYWHVEIFPKIYKEYQIPAIARLREVRQESVVSIRGWSFPHVDREHDGVFEGGIQSVTHWHQYQEAHRLYSSGLFTWRQQIKEDFTDRYSNSISYISSIYSITEYFIFASRLATLVAKGGDFIIRIGVTGLKGHVLRMDSDGFDEDYETMASEFNRSYDVSLEGLRASHLDFAADATRQLFELYGLDITLDTIKEWQTRFINRTF